MIREIGNGVFPEAVDKRAFLDRVRLSLWGKKRISSMGTSEVTNKPIGGPNRPFARSERGILSRTGNPYELRYGGSRERYNLPPMVLVVRSERRPLTVTSLRGAVNTLCEPGWRAKVSEIELTFDLSGVSVEWLRRRIFTKARRFVQLRDRTGRRTLYVGGRTCPWQLRIYDKVAGVVRVEFVLRRPFLRESGINTPRDLRKLRKLDLGSLARICRLNKTVLNLLKGSLPETPQLVLEDWLRDLPLRELIRTAKDCGWKLPPTPVVPARRNQQLLEMHSRLIL